MIEARLMTCNAMNTGLPLMKSECEDQHAADEPHRPSTAADSCGATLTPQVDDLGHVGGDRYCDAEDPKDLKHEPSSSSLKVTAHRAVSRGPSPARSPIASSPSRSSRVPVVSALSFAGMAHFRHPGLTS